MSRISAIALLLLALLAGCAATPQATEEPAETPQTMPGAEAQPAEAPEGGAPATTRPMLSGAAARNEVQKILRQSFDWLDAGEEDKAREELEYANQLDPDNKQVNCLLRGINADPVTALGKESTPYTVRAGETLGVIARRAMGDVCEFYILARYNQIKVPKQLAAGQVIRLPGRVVLAPEPVAPIAPVVAPAAKVPATVVVPAPKPDSTPPAPVVVEPAKPKPEVDERARRAAVDLHHRNGLAAYRRQDLATAIREWDAVLALDPNNNLARVRRQEALDLQNKLNSLKK